MLKITVLFFAVFWINSAAAINKCVDANGKITYQETQCPNQSKSSEEVKIWTNNSNSSNGGWKFKRAKDDMTRKVACLAMSSITFPQKPQPTGFMPVHMVVSVTADLEVIGLRTSDNKNLFHNDIDGMGIKADNGEFIPFDMKSGSHVVGFKNSKTIIDMLEKSKTLSVRARFWPYEQLYDMAPISSTGFISALNEARTCAGRRAD